MQEEKKEAPPCAGAFVKTKFVSEGAFCVGFFNLTNFNMHFPRYIL